MVILHCSSHIVGDKTQKNELIWFFYFSKLKNCFLFFFFFFFFFFPNSWCNLEWNFRKGISKWDQESSPLFIREAFVQNCYPMSILPGYVSIHSCIADQQQCSSKEISIIKSIFMINKTQCSCNSLCFYSEVEIEPSSYRFLLAWLGG